MTRARYDHKYPQWMRSVPRTKPVANEPGQLLTPTERLAEHDIREGSDKLLAAIWRRHHRIMLVAQACGRQVARPVVADRKRSA